MRKNLYLAAATASLILPLVSCSSDEPAIVHNDGVSITIKVPSDMMTRATFGDESTVTLDNLQWTVYDVTDPSTPKALFDGVKPSAFQSSQTQETVDLQLIKGKTYQVAFFADNSANEFVTYSDGTVNVDYTKAASNEANEDAFVGKSQSFTLSDEGHSETITLTRPFAQLNWGTDDLAAVKKQLTAEEFNALTAAVEVKNGLYSSMNVLSGDVADPVTSTVTFSNITFDNLPTESFPTVSEFKVYDLIAMNYLLTGEGTIDCQLTLSSGNGNVEVSAANVNTNYRTNIYGSLLTAPASFNILVDNNFETPDYNIPVGNNQEFMAALESGKPITVKEGAVIDISNEGEIQLQNGQNLVVNGTLKTTRQQISVSGADNSVTVSGTGTIIATGEKGSRPLNVYDGATLTVTGVNVSSTQNNGGSTIYSEGGNLILKDMKSVNNSNFAVGANGGTLVMENCEIASDSNNKQGSYSYTISVREGCQATLTNVDVTAIQGGVTVEGAGSVCTIKSGTYTTHSLAGATGQTAFYPVMVTNKGRLIIEGGEFISGCNVTVKDFDNDVNMPLADSIEIKGGKFNAPTYTERTGGEIPVAEGYKWVDINDGVFKYEVVKK